MTLPSYAIHGTSVSGASPVIEECLQALYFVAFLLPVARGLS